MKQLLSLAVAALFAITATAQVTFNVNMHCAPEDFDDVFVTGPWCGWCTNEGYNAMTDDDGDNEWTVTIADLTGTVEYKYAINGFTDQENLVNDMAEFGADCAPITDYNVYANRTIEAGEGVVAYDTYGTCSGVCNDEILSETQVTFHVDMSGYEGTEDPSQVTWNSAANGWCGNCAPLDDVDGDGIYSITVPLTGDTVEYKFAIGAWADEEDLEPETSCTKTTYDEGAPNGCCFVNRIVALNGEDAIDMPVVCWNSCQACGAEPVAGCTDMEACNYNAEASTDDGSCVYGDGPMAGFDVLDALCAGGTGLLSLDSATIELYASGVTFQVDDVELVYGSLDLAAGSYTLTATDSLGCSSDSAFVVEAPDAIEILITVTDAPVGGTGSAVISPVGGFGEITWSVVDVIGSPVDPSSLSAGTYTVTAVDSNDCTATATFVVGTDNVSELELLQGSVFPVPVKDVLNVQLAQALGSNAIVSILDVQGREVSNSVMRSGTQTLILDASSWTQGAYIIQIVTDEAKASWNFVK